MANRTDVSKTLAWNQVINNSNGHASLDYHYGPYDSIDDVPEAMRVTGFTCAVMEGGRPAEWWWTGSAWERKGVPNDVYVRYRGVAESLDALDSTEAEAGDMYIVPVTGAGGQVEEYREYIRAEGRWELLGTRTAGVSGSLTVEGAGDAFTVTDKGVRASSYNGTQNVTLDMGRFSKDGHDHDARYYTEAEVDAMLAGVYTKEEVDAKCADYFPGSALDDAIELIVNNAYLKERIASSDWFQEAVESAVQMKLIALYNNISGALCLIGGKVYRNTFSATPTGVSISKEDTGVSVSGGEVTAKAFYEGE